jgi:hypothetical protein
VTEKLEYEPANFSVIETVRAKYACPHGHASVVEAPAPAQVVFDRRAYARARRADRFLADFRGKLQADEHRGYDAVREWARPRNRLWAHARHCFVEAFMTDTTPARLIGFIQKLYLERTAADLMPEARQTILSSQGLPQDRSSFQNAVRRTLPLIWILFKLARMIRANTPRDDTEPQALATASRSARCAVTGGIYGSPTLEGSVMAYWALAGYSTATRCCDRRRAIFLLRRRRAGAPVLGRAIPADRAPAAGLK